MKKLKDLKNAIIFLPDEEKEIILEYLSDSFHELKLMTYEELLNKYYFSYDEKTIAYLMKKYSYHYDVAKIILNNLKYLNGKAPTEKLKQLETLKEELIKENLLTFDPYFKDYLKRFKLYYLNALEDEFILSVFKEIKAQHLEIEREQVENQVYVFNDKNQELEYFFGEVISLIKKGVPKNKIKVSGINKDNRYDFERLANLHKLAFNSEKASLLSFEMTSNYLANLDKTQSFSEALSFLENNKSSLLKLLLSRINKVNNLKNSFEIKRDILFNLLKNTKVSRYYEDEIQIVDLNNYNPQNEDYLFVLSFTKEDTLRTFKDEDYLNDLEKTSLNLDSSVVKNKKSKLALERKVKHHKMYLSYVQNDEINHLVADLNLTADFPPLRAEIYSKSLVNIKSSKALDDLLKYEIEDYLLSSYYNLSDKNYRSYSNEFTPIKDFKLESLKLSYSSLETYANCPFKYYLKYILKLEEFNLNFAADLGSFYHEVLELIFKEEKSFEEAYNLSLGNFEFSKKEIFLLENLKEDFIKAVSLMKNFSSKSKLKAKYFEKEIEVALDEKTIIRGTIDKVLHFKLDSEDLISVLDYKTGSYKIDLKYMDYGLNLQLPIYWFLIKNSKLFNNPVFTGVYIQPLNIERQNYNNKLDLEKEAQKNLKLRGFSSSNLARLKLFDPSYEASDFIHAMGLIKDGSFKAHAKVLSDDEVSSLEESTKNTLTKFAEDIYQGEFKIQPKKANQIDSCKYCQFRDICFKKEEDYLELKVGDEDV